MADDSNFVPLQFVELPESEMFTRARLFYQQLQGRRTTRQFSTRSVPRELIELAVSSAGTAPSGAHLQPWTFVMISNSELKKKIRTAAENEERRFYAERIPEAWEEVLSPLDCNSISSQSAPSEKWGDGTYLLFAGVMWYRCRNVYRSHP
jgi:iodotyrosine deiodinase